MTRLRRFDLIVFDWDGTLFDSTALIARCIQASCADLDQPVPSVRDARGLVVVKGIGDTLPVQPGPRLLHRVAVLDAVNRDHKPAPRIRAA